MYRSPFSGRIRPKLSTMPTQRSEARIHLNIYKLSVEKERLEKELINLETRRQQLRERLETLNIQIETELSWARKSRHHVQKQLNLPHTNSNIPIKTMTVNY